MKYSYLNGGKFTNDIENKIMCMHGNLFKKKEGKYKTLIRIGEWHDENVWNEKSYNYTLQFGLP